MSGVPQQYQSAIRSCLEQAVSKMGKEFGNLYKLRRIVYFRLSPYEQNIFAGFFKDGVPNMVRRINGCIFRVTPPFALLYLIYNWANDQNYALHRKDPKVYENDT